MKLLVEAAAGEELSIGGERHTVHWLLVPEFGRIFIHCRNRSILRSGNKKMFSPHDVLLGHLVSLWTLVPLSTSHNRTVESKEALARTRFMFGLFVPADI